MNPLQKHVVGRRNLALAGMLFGSGLLALTAANPANWLHTGFETAINGHGATQHVASQHRTWTPLIAGSEDFWLGTPSVIARNPMMQPATWQAPIAKGDRFTISAATHVSNRTLQSAAREYEVVNIEPLTASAMSNESGQPAAALSRTAKDQFLVICRSTDKDHQDILKFVIDRTSGLPWASAPTHTAQAL